MRILKSHPLLSLANGYLVDSPQPSNLSYLWNFGSLLAFCLVIQIVTGVTLAMHYNPSVLEAFNSVEHIMRDVNNGWLIRYLHSNTASAFFFLVYLHIGRNLYYGSYRAPRTLVFSIGVVIFILMIVTAFLGLLHSPKWFKSNYNNNNTFHYTKYRKILKINHQNYLGKRQFSTMSKSSLNIINESSNSLPEKNSEAVTRFLAETNLKPVFIYEDLKEVSVRQKVLEDTRSLSGIYLILNKTNLSYYIGSASTGKFYARLSNHLFNFRGSKVVKSAVRKHGISSFAFIVLELFPEVVTKENNKKLLDLEDYYLKSFLPDYNILTEAGNCFGYKHSEITRIKIRENYRWERHLAIASLNQGRVYSEEEKEKLRFIALNRKPLTYTQESFNNTKKSSKAIIVYNFDDTVYGEYPSITEGAEHLSCDEKTITRALKTPKQILKRRWIVKYK
jgi:group I intron endonuclease